MDPNNQNQPQNFPEQPQIVSGGTPEVPVLPEKKPPKKKLIIAAAAVLVVAVIAGAVIMGRQLTGGGSVVDGVKSQADLAKLNDEQKKEFCAELVKMDPEGPEVKALHDRLGYSGDLTQNLFLGCAVSQSNDDYLKKDQAGQNEEQYRERADEDKAVAKTVTFDLYDTTYKSNDVGLSKRVAIDIDNEAKNILMEYSTLQDGAFSPYTSREAISIRVFDPRDFPALTINCGPNLMRIEFAKQHNNDDCTKTNAAFMGQPIYKGEGISNPSYNVTVNNTRIVVEARSEQEALAVIAGMKKVSVDQMDFFIKN